MLPVFCVKCYRGYFCAGWIVDRFSTVHLLRFFMLPLAFWLLLIAITDKTFVAPLFMVLIGTTAGAVTIVISSLWVELYGIKYIGSIRSMCFSMVVFSTSISPKTDGILIRYRCNVRCSIYYICYLYFYLFNRFRNFNT